VQHDEPTELRAPRGACVAGHELRDGNPAVGAPVQMREQLIAGPPVDVIDELLRGRTRRHLV
jgi:hypothetical protein